MKKRFLLFIIFIIFILSLITLLLTLNYLDPEQYKITGYISVIFTFVLTVSTFFTIFLYFFKKIYFRGEVYIYHVLTSFRQGFFMALFLLGLLVFNILGASLILIGLILAVLFLFIELFIQNLENN